MKQEIQTCSESFFVFPHGIRLSMALIYYRLSMFPRIGLFYLAKCLAKKENHS